MDRRELRDLLREFFNLSELKSLGYDLGIDYEVLPGNTREERATELVEYCHRHGKINDLLKHCRKLRPHVSWPDHSQDPGSSRRSSPNTTSYPPPTQKSASVSGDRRTRVPYVPFTDFDPRSYHGEISFDFSSVSEVEIIAYTEHSIIERCIVDGQHLIVKRTENRLCDAGIMQHLIGKNIAGNEGRVSVRVATPLATWESQDHVWELHPFYEGVTLREMIIANQQRIKGQVLGQIFNALLVAVNQLHGQGILHRDISPANILITRSSGYLQLLLIDCSFSCFEHLEQIAVGDPSYSAPEQQLGRAARKSDGFSIGATTYFLGNGIPPNVYDEVSLKEGLWNLDSNNYWVPNGFAPADDSLLLEEGESINDQLIWPGIEFVVEKLLKINEDDRPIGLAETLLRTVSTATGGTELTAILTVGELGYLSIYDDGSFKFLDERETREFLQDVRFETEDLKRYAQSLFN